MKKASFHGISAHSEYQNTFAREQSIQMKGREWETRLPPPLQTYWDRAWAGLCFAGAVGALVYLVVMGSPL